MRRCFQGTRLSFFWFINITPNFFQGDHLKKICVDFTGYPSNQFSGYKLNRQIFYFYAILLPYCYLLGFSLEGRREADERGCEDCTIKMMNGWLVLFEAAKAAERETRMRNEKKNRILFVISVIWQAKSILSDDRLQGNFDALNGVICLLTKGKL